MRVTPIYYYLQSCDRLKGVLDDGVNSLTGRDTGHSLVSMMSQHGKTHASAGCRRTIPRKGRKADQTRRLPEAGTRTRACTATLMLKPDIVLRI
jgi:hypothetical protein